MTLTDQLTRSFFDLWHHFDPIAAGRFDPFAPAPAVVDFGPDTLQQHRAALRSLAGAAEEISPDTLDDDIDLTILLDAIRGLEHQLTVESGRFVDPALWAHRLAATVAAREGDPAVLAAIPAWCASAAQALDRPPVFGLATGLALLDAVVTGLAGEAWQGSDGELLTRATVEIEGLIRTLQVESQPKTGGAEGGIGEAAVEHHLQFELQLGRGAAALLRDLAAKAEALWAALDSTAGTDRLAPATTGYLGPTEPWKAHHQLVSSDAVASAGPGGALGAGQLRVAAPAVPAEVLEARYGERGAGALVRGRANAASEIRRRYLTPARLEGWALFSEARAADAAAAATRAPLLHDLHRRVMLGAVDLAIHRRQLSPVDAVARLGERTGWSEPERLAAVRGILLAPMEACGSVLLWQEWERLAGEWEGGEEALRRIVATDGLASPVLLRWRHDAAE